MKVVYYPDVEKKIRSLSKADQSRLIKLVDLFVDYKFSLSKLYLKKITGNLWELRPGNYRLFFGVISGNIIVVNIFRKTSQKSPLKEIKLAIRRLKEYEE